MARKSRGFPDRPAEDLTATGGARMPRPVVYFLMVSQQKSRSNGPKQAWFTRFARWTSCHAGRPSAFIFAALVIVAWAVTGPMFHYSDTWQLVINTSTTIVTFLMVFLIQNTQNRDSQAIHVKLDELIRAKKGARNSLLNLEDLSDEELEQLRISFNKIAEKAKRAAQNGSEETQTDVIAITRKK
jgi:low affinity Fe/Cu permease